jgi:hypothetical protein
MLNRRVGWLLGIAVAAALAAVGANRTARAEDSVPSAKITPWRAMEIANQQVHGKPLTANYELDEGHWLYDVMIAKDKTLHVVEVDANTGKAAKEETSSPEDEAKELVSDLNKALGVTAVKATAEKKPAKEKDEKPD